MSTRRIAPALFAFALAAAGMASAAPKPNPTPTPQPTIKPLPKGIETILYNGHAHSLNGFVIMLTPSPSPAPSAKPQIPTMEQLTEIDTGCQDAPACSHVYVRASDFFKLVGAKVVHMESEAPSGPVTVTYCKKSYDGTVYFDKLAQLGGKPNVDPAYFMNAFNRDLTVQKFSWSTQLPTSAAFAAATKEHAAYQPPAFMTINGPIACKAKKHKKSGAYELEMDSSIEAFTSQTNSTLDGRVTADFGLAKASGTISTMPTGHTVQPPSTKIVAVGSGELTLASYAVKATCDDGKSVVVPTGPYNGQGAATLVGSGDHLALLFNGGQPPFGRWPGVSLECEGHGADSGPAIWFASFMAAHQSDITAGMDLGGGMMGAALMIPLEKSVDGSFEARYARTVTVGSTRITETTTFTVTPNK